MRIDRIQNGREQVSRTILKALPDWFGIDTAREAYVRHAATAPMWGARVDGAVVGYLATLDHFGTTREIHSMGVLPAHHRSGIGRALIETLARDAKEQGFAWLTVKTLADTHPDPNYARTRLFYAAAGFQRFEVLPDFWGPDLPCLSLIRPL